MNAISKKLLSWLCIAAMVLSLVPAMNLSNFAVETEAASINYGSLNEEAVSEAVLETMEFGNSIDNSDEAIQKAIDDKKCPMCGKTGVTWNEGSTTVPTSNDADNATSHYYFNKTSTCTGNFVTLTKTNVTACVALMSKANITVSRYRTRVFGTNCTLNIMGTGKLHANNASGPDGDYGLFTMQGTNNTLNLYGGNFTHTHCGNEFNMAVIRIMVPTAEVNIFDGAAIGPKTVDTTKVAMNVQYELAKNADRAGTVNMYGGVIQNGVSPNWGYSGNVNIAASGTFNMYGGTIKGGTYLSKTTSGVTGNATIGGNVMVGGKDQVIYENYTTSKGTFNMYGGTITDGKANNGGNGGGNVYVSSTGTAKILGGTVQKGNAKYGGNVQVNGGKLTIGGTALITNGKAGTVGGNVQIKGSTLTITGGKIADGTAPDGGNIQASGGTTTISGGVITGGKATNTGGGIQLNGGTTTISGGEIAGGEAKNGGNIYVNTNTVTLNITGGNIADGTSTSYGGNIYVGAVKKFTLTDCYLENGLAASYGGNLYLGSASDDVNKVTISDCVFLDGTADRGGNLATLTNLTVSNTEFLDGIAYYGGGNIDMTNSDKTLTLVDCTLANGWVTGRWDTATKNFKPTGANWGGNIRAWHNSIEIYGGLVYGGVRGPEKSAHAANNIGLLAAVEKSSSSCSAFDEPEQTLTIGGGAVIVGDINLSGPSKVFHDDFQEYYTCPGTRLIVKDTASIVTSYQLENGTVVKASTQGVNIPKNTYGDSRIDVSEMGEMSQIELNVSGLGQVLSLPSENAANVAGCFKLVNKPQYVAAVNENNELVVSEFKADEKPESSMPGDGAWTDEAWQAASKGNHIQAEALKLDPETATTCPACGATGIEWVEIDGAVKALKTDNAKYHYYIDADTKVTKSYEWLALYNSKQTLCILLQNGEAAKQIGGFIGTRGAAKNCTINIMGEGILTSDGTANSDNQFGVISVQGSGNIVNLYGGTFVYTNAGIKKGGTDVEAAALTIRAAGNTINMFDAVTVGPETQDLTKPCYNVRIYTGASTFNMYGGTIRNGVAHQANISGNVHIVSGSGQIFNMYGGSILNGSRVEGTANAGGNIYMNGGVKATINGGTISGGVAAVGGNIHMGNSSLTINGGVIANGQISSPNNSGADWGGNIRCWNGDVTMNGGLIYGGKPGPKGTESANIGVKGDSDDFFTMTGGIIVGDISFYAASANGKYPGTQVKISGDAKIVDKMEIDGVEVSAVTGGAWLSKGNQIDVSKLNADAEIVVSITSSNAGMAITKPFEGVAALKDCFSLTNEEDYCIFLNEETNELYVAKRDDNAMIVKPDGTVESFATNKEALAAYNPAEDAYLTLTGEATIPAGLNEVKLNANGGQLTIKTEGDEKKTITLIDTANKDFETTTGSITVAEGANVEVIKDLYDGEDHYIVIEDNGTYTAHYVEMKLTAVSLRTNADGLYYKVEIKCDDALAARVTKFGVAVQVGTAPAKLTSSNHSYSTEFQPDENHAVTAKSLELFGILKNVNTSDRTAEQNALVMEAKVYANLYVEIDGEDVVFGYKRIETVGLSLYEVVAKINEKWDTMELTAAAKVNMKRFAEKWNDAAQLGEAGQAKWQAAVSNIIKEASDNDVDMDMGEFN